MPLTPPPEVDSNAVMEFAVLLPIIDIFEQWVALHAEAEKLYESYPKAVRDRIDAKAAESSISDLLLELSQSNPKERRDQRRQLQESIDAIRRLLEDRRAAAELVVSAGDLELLYQYLKCLPNCGTRSKRETRRFWDAVELGDAGTLKWVHSRKNGKSTIEAKFSSDRDED